MANYPTVNLQPGSTGDAVKQLQDYLVSQGYMTQAQVNSGYGIYGPQTTAAVKALQENLGIDNSSGPGYFGPKTIAGLQAKSSPNPSTGSDTGRITINGDGYDRSGLTAIMQKEGHASLEAAAAAHPELANKGYGAYANYGYTYVPPTPVQNTSTKYSTGNSQLDALLGEMQGYLDKLISSGKTVNPNIELTPAEIQGFLDQASTEINPYYKSQFDVIKKDLSSNLDLLQKSYELNKENSLSDFTKSLGASRESASGAGTIFSGVRGKNEQQLVDAENRILKGQDLQTKQSAQNAVTTAERQIGSRNLSDITLPTFNSVTASNSGLGSFVPSRTLDYFSSGGITGSLEREQTTAVQSRAANLEEAARKTRALNLY